MTTPPVTERLIATNGIELHTLEAGEGPLMVLCHGFPELAHSWRHQIPTLAAAGYHVLAPDQRGYGRSSIPEPIEDYDIEHLVGDMLGVLDAAGADQAVFVGHDWGAMVVWALAQRHPERVGGVVGLSVPFVPRGPMPPTALLRSLVGDSFFYILYFQQPGVADADLGGDPRRFLRGMFAGISGDVDPGQMAELVGANDGRGMVARLPQPEDLPAWLNPADLDLYVGEFERSGFTGGINWYRNFDRNWERSEALADVHVTVPALFITGAGDPVRMMTPAGLMDGCVDDLRGSVVIDGAGHWVQQERPAEVNALLLDFLRGLAPNGPGSGW